MSHQMEGRGFLVGKRRGILAFEQGLGKTLTAIKAFLELRHQHRSAHMLGTMPEFAEADMESGDRKIYSCLDRQDY